MKKTIKTLDLRSMPPFERHSKIFEMWENLAEGETFKIINDHEPKPLYYQFEAEHNGEFEWHYEQQGPKDWIFRIKKIPKQNSNKEEIKEVIRQLHDNDDNAEIKEKARRLLKDISPVTLGLLEQELIKEGTTREEMRKLCSVHLEIMKEGMGKQKIELKKGHPINTLMEEHKMILEFIDKLKHAVKKIDNASDYRNVQDELEMLAHIAEHLVEADKHHKREEDVLFPMLEKFGVSEPPEIMREEHNELKLRKKELFKIANEHKKFPYEKFAEKIKELSGFLIKELPDHIYKEDNILYPMALQAIPKEKWDEIKKKCDDIGYCCFTPER